MLTAGGCSPAVPAPAQPQAARPAGVANTGEVEEEDEFGPDFLAQMDALEAAHAAGGDPKRARVA